MAVTMFSDSDRALTAAFAPRVVPHGWTRVNEFENVLRHIHRKLHVIVTGRIEADGRRWIHVSISHRDRVPSWEELKEIKDWIIGRDKLAIQVLPPEAQYVNDHPYCLHLWHCLGVDPVPDFRYEGSI